MKAIFTTIVLVFALGYGGFAQQVMRMNMNQMTPEERTRMQVMMAQRQTQQMKERLKLDEEQEKAISEINVRYAVLRVQLAELAQTQEGTDLPALLRELEERQENEILPFLNEDQIDPYFALKKEQQERMQRMMQQQGAGGQRGGGQQRGEGQRGEGQRGGGEQQRRQRDIHNP